MLYLFIESSRFKCVLVIMFFNYFSVVPQLLIKHLLKLLLPSITHLLFLSTHCLLFVQLGFEE